jgi:starch synthase
MIFFCRGVLETVKKLGWAPDIIHCHGWFTSLIPLLVKTSYHEDPNFHNSKVIVSVYNDEFNEKLGPHLQRKVKMEGMSNSDIKDLKEPNYVSLMHSVIANADGIILGSATINQQVKNYIARSGKPSLTYQGEDYIDAYSNFYDELIEDSVLV